MKIAILCNTKSSEFPNRPELIDDLIKEGNLVYFGAINNGLINNYYKEKSKVIFIPIIATRNNLNPLKELVSLWSIKKEISKNKIEATLIYGVKNHGAMSIGSKWGGAKQIICVVNGSGNLFTIKGLKGLAIRGMSFPVLKLAYALSTYVCFQNPDDEKLFIHRHLVNKNKCFLTHGSGVNLSEFSISQMPKEPRFLFLSRITPSKGIYEYIEAAKIVKKKFPNAEFDVVGPVDEVVENSCSLQINKAVKENIIKYHGKTDNVKYWLDRCRFFVYPSYHEGVPRCILQAMAVGRPIITSDAPGCRETVDEGVNGVLAPTKDSNALAKKIFYLLENPKLAERMGIESRKIAEIKFNVHNINMEIIQHFN